VKLSNEQKLVSNKLLGGIGHYSSRLCFCCNRPKSQAGGQTDKRTRQWVCMECKK
jgi:hypothetical protein